MLLIWIHTLQNDEYMEIERTFSEAARKMYSEPPQLEFVDAMDSECGAEEKSIDIAVIDVTRTVGLEHARQIRQSGDDKIMLLIADMTISPVLYVNSKIRAQTLLLRPWTKEEISTIIEETVELWRNQKKKTSRSNSVDRLQQCLPIEADGTKRLIPYSVIYYFEARCKKVYIRTKDKEYGVYGTLEKIENELPPEFIRCHRSFIINRRHLREVKFSENIVILSGQMSVPLSRTYKARIREIFRDGK